MDAYEAAAKAAFKNYWANNEWGGNPDWNSLAQDSKNLWEDLARDVIRVYEAKRDEEKL